MDEVSGKRGKLGGSDANNGGHNEQNVANNYDNDYDEKNNKELS